MTVNIPKPYALYLGHAQSALQAKTSSGIAHWCPGDVVAEVALEGAELRLVNDRLTPKLAKQRGAQTLIIGLANSGGFIAPEWLPDLKAALKAGLNVAAGLHHKLRDIPELVSLAKEHGCELFDLRADAGLFRQTGKGARRPGKRLLTVGTDCAVGKMFSALSITKVLKEAGLKATFRASGQTGIFIAGAGICIDAVLSDFAAGAVEELAPANDEDHWDIIEGQGSLYNPSFAAVSLALLHGAQADLVVLCHHWGRMNIKDLEDFAIPSLKDCAELNIQHAQLTNPCASLGAIALNTNTCATDEEARKVIEEIEDELGVPCFDPMRTGAQAILRAPLIAAALQP